MARIDIEEVRRQVRVRRLLACVPKGRWGSASDAKAVKLMASWSASDRNRFTRACGIPDLTATQWRAFLFELSMRSVTAELSGIRL